MKKRKGFLALVLFLVLLMPGELFAQDDYASYPFKEPLNDQGTVHLYMDKDLDHFVIAGKGKMKNPLELMNSIYQAFGQRTEEIVEKEGEDSPKLEEIWEKQVKIEAEGLVLEIKSGVQFPDDASYLFQGLVLKDILFPKDFDTSNVTNMEGLFSNQPYVNPDVGNWDTSKVTNMTGMFNGAQNANPDVSRWDVSKVETMAYMFNGAQKANPDVSRWDTSSIKDEGLAIMFCFASNANPDTSRWVIGDIDFIQNLFWGTKVSEVDMRTWKFKKGASGYDTAAAFYDTNNLQYIYLAGQHPEFEYSRNIMAGDFKMQKDGEPASSIMPGSHDQYDFINTGKPTLYFVPQKTSINTIWKDKDDKDGFRPAKQEVELLANGKKIGGTITQPQGENPVNLNLSNNWTTNFSDMDIFNGGQKINYSVQAEDLDDYITDIYFKKDGTVLASSQEGKVDGQKDGFTLVNTYMTIEEEKPLGKKPRVPKNFVKVRVDRTDKGDPAGERVFWVTPNRKVQLPVEAPLGKRDSSKGVTYVFSHWQEVTPGKQIWEKDKKIEGQFKEDTVIRAVYQEEKVGQEGIYFFEPWEKPKKELKIDGHHDQYLFGYPDGRVRPQGEITRAEAAALIARLEGFDLTDTSKPDFKDVESAWHNSAINALVKAKVMVGYPDGSFRPTASIQRSEFTQMIKMVDKKSAPNKPLPFNDLDGSWAYDPIQKAYSRGLIVGYPDGSFKPDAYISRAEATVILNKLYDRQVKEEGLRNFKQQLRKFSDLEESHWAYYELMEAAHSHSYTRKEAQSIEEIWQSLR